MIIIWKRKKDVYELSIKFYVGDETTNKLKE